MTTATSEQPSAWRASPVVGAAAVTSVFGLLCVAVAAVVAASPAAAGAAVGAVTSVVVYTFGAATLSMVARLAPAYSLFFALLTYALQLVLVTAVLAGVMGKGEAGQSIEPRWLSGTLIACTLAWVVAQTMAFTRLRVPVYDLAEHRPANGSAKRPASGPSGVFLRRRSANELEPTTTDIVR